MVSPVLSWPFHTISTTKRKRQLTVGLRTRPPHIDPKVNPNESPYAVFGGNPILYSDVLGDEWKDKAGNALNTDKLKDVKVYLFYDPKENGEHGGFGEQTMKQYDMYETQYGKGSVALSAAPNVKTFKEDWSSMNGKPAIVAINMHGSNQAVHINSESKPPQYLSSNETGKTNTSKTPAFEIKALPLPKADLNKAVLQLNTCSSNDHLGFKHGTTGSNLTVAEGFRKYFNFNSVRTTGWGVSYNKDGTARPQLGSWQYLKRGDLSNFDQQMKQAKYLQNIRHKD